VACGDYSLRRDGLHSGDCRAAWCRSWGCPPCAAKRSVKLIDEGKAGKPNRFVTLTIRRLKHQSPNVAAKCLVLAFQTSMKRWQRLRPGNRAEYFAVFEATKNGYPHLHVLWRGPWLDQRWLSAQMAELIGSPIVHVEQVQDARKAARYVAKYLGKAPHRFGTCKRYWHSRSWSLAPAWEPEAAPEPGMTWWHSKWSVAVVHADWQARGRNPCPIVQGATHWNEGPERRCRGSPWAGDAVP
jgi:hypothetical protein